VPSSIRELIIQNIKAELEKITIANGYQNDVVNVQRFLQPGVKGKDIPYLIIFEGDETVTEQSSNVTWKDLIVRVGIITAQDEDVDGRAADEIVGTLRADVEKAMLVDRLRGSNAIETTFMSSTAITAEEGQPSLEIELQFNVHYHQVAGDPYTIP